MWTSLRLDRLSEEKGCGMKKILVTGGTVFVSKYVSEYYVSRGGVKMPFFKPALRAGRPGHEKSLSTFTTV